MRYCLILKHTIYFIPLLVKLFNYSDYVAVYFIGPLQFDNDETRCVVNCINWFGYKTIIMFIFKKQ